MGRCSLHSTKIKYWTIGKNINFFDTPREDSAVFLKENYYEMEFTASLEASAQALTADRDHIRKQKLGPILSQSY